MQGLHLLRVENKLFLVFILATLSLLSGSSAFAQEHSYGKEEPVVHEMPSDVHGTEGEAAKIHPADTAVSFRPAVTKTKVRISDARHQEDEEALKFNFLYFIIQKFKFSDIID